MKTKQDKKFVYSQWIQVSSIKNNLFKASCAMKQVFCPSLSHLFRSNAELVFEDTVGRSKGQLFPCGLLLPSKIKFWGCPLPLGASGSKMPPELLTGRVVLSRNIFLSVSK